VPADSLILDSRSMNFIKRLAKKYQLGTTTDTINILLYTILDIANMLEDKKSDYIGFIDTSGNKSFNLKNGDIFNLAKKDFIQDKDAKLSVSSFIDDMCRSFILEDVKKHYDKHEDTENV